MQSGKFITFEGGEGAGKTTQVGRLAERLRALGLEIVVTREPGGTPLGESVREVVLGNAPEPVTELLLFAAARAEHVAKVIRPALGAGTWVICDRFIDSTRVYQGLLGGVPADLITAIEVHTVAPSYPDLTFMLDLPADVGLKRTAQRGAQTRFDAGTESFHVSLREAFRQAAAAEPERCLVLDANREADAVAADIWAAVEMRLFTGGNG